jgi:hypothetical protein
MAGLFNINETATGSQMKFLNITIPKGATITEAHFEVVCSDTTASTTVNSKIRGVDADNAVMAANTGEFENPPFTTAVVNWDNIPTWNNGDTKDSPDIKTIIQEIIDRSGWVSGNAMIIQWDDMEKRSTQSDNVIRKGISHNNFPAKAPLLHIEYTVPATGFSVVSDVGNFGVPS